MIAAALVLVAQPFMVPRSVQATTPGPAAVRDGHARFEVLTPTLIRLEYAGDDHFEDRTTMTAVNRAFPTPQYSTTIDGGTRVIRTEAMTLRYTRDSGPFTPQNLQISLSVGGTAVTAQPNWTAGANPGNLGGWQRALDNQTGPVSLHDGLLSRSGWYLLDDSHTVLLTGGSPGFAVRPAHDGAYQDGYFFGYGHDYTRGLSDLRALTGPAPLLPRKAFGVWFSRYWPYTEQDYHDLVARFRAELVPLDTLSVDTDWKRVNNAVFAPLAATAAGADPTRQFSWNGWEWNRTIFPDPQRFLDWAHAQGIAVTLNIHPSISSDDPQWAATQSRSGGLGTTTGMCQLYMADPATCGVFDWADPRQLDAYFELHAPLEQQGVDFWWLDWCCDPSHADAPGLTSDTWINSRYALRNQARNQRWPAFSRIGASNGEGDAGTGGGPGAFAEHRYTVHFTGDTCATWSMLAFEAQFTAAEGNIGEPYVSHDIGSFNGVPVAGQCQATGRTGHLPDDIYARWLQLGAFQPIERLHSDHGDRLPWQYGPAARASGDKFLRLREALVPYLYTVARESYDTGLPMTRVLYLQWPDDSAAYDHPSEYTLGRDVVVAPVTSPGDPALATVWVPPGTWFDYFTGATYQGPATVQLSVPLDRMPVLMRAGAILPTQPDLPTTQAAPQDPLVVTAWPGAGGSFRLYDDQGQGFAYQGGAYAFTRIDHSDNAARKTLTIGPAQGSFPGAPATRSWEVRFAGIDQPRDVSVNGMAMTRAAGATASGWWYDAAAHTAVVRTAELPTNAPVSVTAEMAAATSPITGHGTGAAAAAAAPNTARPAAAGTAAAIALALFSASVIAGRRRRARRGI